MNFLRGMFCTALLLCVLGLCIPSAFGTFFAQATDEERMLTVTAVSSAPVAQEITGETFAGVYVELPLTATDAEGDAVIFQLLDMPRLGTAAIDGAVLQYTPNAEGKTGTDKFTYCAIDTAGNQSEPAKIKIKIRKNTAKMTYADMEKNPAHYTALCLAQEGILTGEQIGGVYFFHPTANVTRSEFIAMASAAAHLPVKQTMQTDFVDDAGLSAWAKPYISAAASTGLISGYLTPAGTAEIRGEQPITIAEASVIVSNLLTENLEVPETVSTIQYGQTVPVWASTAAARLQAASILPVSENTNTHITRQTACEMLYDAMQLMHS